MFELEKNHLINTLVNGLEEDREEPISGLIVWSK